MNICIGVDPSMNSSGIAILTCDDDFKIIKEQFYIIKPDKLTKRETLAKETYKDLFDYILYDRLDPAQATNNHDAEFWKTLNMVSVVQKISDITAEYINGENNVYVLQEGISYGSSIRTKSIFDLAGLNYLLRNAFIQNKNVIFTIATPSEIKKFTTGSGNCKKEQMVELFKITHTDFELPKLDDISDAYWMAKYAYKIMVNKHEENLNNSNVM
jgi:Holliday junction resolvasome RuvABC endonuclease subunit